MSGSALQTVRAGPITFTYLEAGSGPLALCLHGFPDTPYGLAPVVDALAGAGYRAVAPYMRGYPPTSCSPDGDYGLTAIGGDVLAMIAALGEGHAFVFGHDWGAVATYVAANLAPHRIRAMATVAVPHLGGIRLELAQLRRSWYMAFFQLRGIAERRVRANDFALIERLWRDWSPGWRWTSDDIGRVKKCFAQPGAVEAALGYYRSALARVADREVRRVALARTSVPAISFAGEDDGCIGIDLFRTTDRRFTGGYELVRISGAGHFMHCERPELVTEPLVRHFDAHR